MTQPLDLVNLDTNRAYTVSGPEFVVGRGRDVDLPVLDLEFSRRQFRIISKNDGYCLEGLSASVPTYCDERVVDHPVRLEQGMQIRVAKTRFLVRFQRQPYDSARASSKRSSTGIGAESSAAAATIVPTSTASEDFQVHDLTEAIMLEGSVVLGRGMDADISLPHIQVSRQHARIYSRDGVHYLQDLGSANGTFLDGELITAPSRLKLDCMIGVGPYSLTYLGDRLVPVSRTNNVQLEAHSLTCRVPDLVNSSDLKVILDQVSLVIRPREFICLLGPSGSGKSTLLSALSARVPASSGTVLVNGMSLYDNFESLKSEIAVVPQRDIMHEALTIENALEFSARLRLPADTTDDEIRRQIDDLLISVGLEEHRSKPIRVLSGGQRRRASLANELISNPSILFLDEVTSGLDEESDREMMQLFRQLADSGKTVICVTHTLANIPETCHLVAFLGVGGKLAFFGPPHDALQEFQIDRLGAFYGQLEDRSQVAELQSKCVQSATFQRYVTERFSGQAKTSHAENVSPQIHHWQHQLRSLRVQLPILLRRYWAVFVTDRQAVGGLLLQCLVVALVLYLVFGDVDDASTPAFRRATLSCQVLFVLAVSAFWFGCNNSAKEIVKERGIYTKELQANLDPTSYYFSKFLLQLGVVTLQATLLLLLVSWWCGLTGSLTGQLCVLIAGCAAGIAVGLFISSISTTEETALTLVPLVLIPQIILSDVFVELTGFSKLLGGLFVSNYWIYGALRGLLPDLLMEQLNSPLAAPINAKLALFAVAVQIVLLAVSSILVIHVRDRMQTGTKKSFLQILTRKK